MHGQISSFWKVLSEQAVGVLVGTPLPRTLWIAKVHINIGCQCEPLVVNQFFAPVPCKGLGLRAKHPVILRHSMHHDQPWRSVPGIQHRLIVCRQIPLSPFAVFQPQTMPGNRPATPPCPGADVPVTQRALSD